MRWQAFKVMAAAEKIFIILKDILMLLSIK